MYLANEAQTTFTVTTFSTKMEVIYGLKLVLNPYMLYAIVYLLHRYFVTLNVFIKSSSLLPVSLKMLHSQPHGEDGDFVRSVRPGVCLQHNHVGGDSETHIGPLSEQRGSSQSTLSAFCYSI